MDIHKINMHALLIIIGIGLVAWFLYSWLPVRNIEEPKYAIVSNVGGYEIREYASYIVAETTVSGVESRNQAARKGFPIIAGYIFGDNTKKDKIAMTVPVNAEDGTSEKIAMTVPVTTEKIAMTVPVNTQEGVGGGSYTISFVMPSKYTLETLPEPNDRRVMLREVPVRKVAVRRFSWTVSESAFKKYEAELLGSLKRDGFETVGVVNTARYNTPWTIPFMLRNEVQIEVKY